MLRRNRLELEQDRKRAMCHPNPPEKVNHADRFFFSFFQFFTPWQETISTCGYAVGLADRTFESQHHRFSNKVKETYFPARIAEHCYGFIPSQVWPSLRRQGRHLLALLFGITPGYKSSQEPQNTINRTIRPTGRTLTRSSTGTKDPRLLISRAIPRAQSIGGFRGCYNRPNISRDKSV